MKLKVDISDFEKIAIDCFNAIEKLQSQGVYDQADMEKDISYLEGVSATLPNPHEMDRIIRRVDTMIVVMWRLGYLVSEEK